jgi:hypothetical protein
LVSPGARVAWRWGTAQNVPAHIFCIWSCVRIYVSSSSFSSSSS